jgi:hypothetical protein
MRLDAVASAGMGMSRSKLKVIEPLFGGAWGRFSFRYQGASARRRHAPQTASTH